MIAVDQVQRYASASGVTCNAALQWSELLSEWQAGTASGTVATTNAGDGNAGDGDLELELAGTVVSFAQESQSDFNSGTTGGGLSSPASGGVTFTPTQAIQFQATQGIPGLGVSYTYVKIWSGSYTIATSNIFFYDIWISGACPQKMAAMDFVLSDGTTLSVSQATVGVDAQGVGPSPANDLSGLAVNQWYTRRFFIDGGGNWQARPLPMLR